MQYVQIPTIVSADFARQIVKSGLEPEKIRKKDIVKCLKALNVSSPEILSLKRKDDLWIQLVLASAI